MLEHMPKKQVPKAFNSDLEASDGLAREGRCRRGAPTAPWIVLEHMVKKQVLMV